MNTPTPKPEPVTQAELLSCPFCGARIHLDYDKSTGMFGPEGTHESGCFIGNWDMRDYADEHHAIAAWNTRLSTEQAAKVEEPTVTLSTLYAYEAGLKEGKRLAATAAPVGDDVVERVAALIRKHHRTHVRQPKHTLGVRRTFHQGDKEAATAILSALKAGQHDTSVKGGGG